MTLTDLAYNYQPPPDTDASQVSRPVSRLPMMIRETPGVPRDPIDPREVMPSDSQPQLPFGGGLPGALGLGSIPLSGLARVLGQPGVPPQDQQPPREPLPSWMGGPQLAPVPSAQFPSTPSQPKTEEAAKPDTIGAAPPPEPKAPPRGEPYIPSPRNRPLSELGRPDLALQYAGRYPGMLPAPYFPQPHELPGVFANSFRILGGLGSNIIARAALGLSGYLPQYWAAQQRGEEIRAKTAASNFKLEAQRVAQLQAAESRAYSEVWAVYGPGSKNYNEETLRQELRRVALDPRFQDDRMLQALDRGLPSVEALMKARDAANQDNIKALTATAKIWQIRNAELAAEQKRLAIEAAKRKAAETDAGYDSYRLRPGGGTGAPAAPAVPQAAPTDAPADAPDGGLEWPTEKDVPAAAPAAPETSSTEDGEPQAEAEPETQQAAAEPESETTPETPATAQRETPPAEAAAPTGEAAGAPAEAAAAPARPVRLAQADTGTATDAGLARAEPPRAEMPEWLQHAREGARAPAAPAAPATTGAAAPVRPVPAEDPLMTSPALRAARNHVDPITGAPDPLDPSKINSDAQRLSMGALLGKDYNQIPKAVRGYIQARRSEIDAELDRIATDPNISGKAVLDRLDRLVPEFSAAMKGWISGDFAVPQSAWKNPAYVQRIQALGQKVDPQFTASNFPVRQRTKQSFANGQFARMIISNATLDFHAGRYIENLKKLDEIQKNTPMLWAQLQRYLGPSNIGAALGITDPALRDLISKINVDHEIVATEGVRAASGAAPHASALDRALAKLDFVRNTVPGAISATQELQTEAQKRNIALANHYDTVVGLGAQKDALSKLIRGYEQGLGGSARDSKTGATIDMGMGSSHLNPGGDELGPYQPASPEIINHAQQMVLLPEARSAPAAPAPAGRPSAPPSGRRAHPQTDAARAWAREHPDDPRAKQILERVQ